MPDSSEIDAALVAKLGADTALLALMPNGVYVDEAPPGMTRFVIVSLVEAHDVAEFGRRAIEDAVYLVKAVALSTANANIRAAAARIDALLEDGVLTVAGYTHMAMHRVERVRATEVIDVDSSLRWQHRGGRYQVVVATV
jgi:hypothetical protein